jgi:hypothetical protein
MGGVALGMHAKRAWKFKKFSLVLSLLSKDHALAGQIFAEVFLV